MKKNYQFIFGKKAITPIVTVVLLVVVATILVTLILSWSTGFTNKGLDKTKEIIDSREYVYNQLTVNSFTAATLEASGHLEIKNLGPNNVTITGYTITDEEGNNQEVTLGEEINIVEGATAIVPIDFIVTGTKVNVVLSNSENYFSLPVITKTPQETPIIDFAAPLVLGGIYNADQTVILTSTTPGAEIYYTTNGTTPTVNSFLYSGPISVTANTTIKSVAYLRGIYSDLSSNAYFLKVVDPTSNLPDGNYLGDQDVTLSTTTSGAEIYYTTDGTDPSGIGSGLGTSLLYSKKVTITTGTTVLKSKAFKTNWTPSSTSTNTYVIATATGLVLAPVASIASGAYVLPITVSLTTATPGAEIYYTTDGKTNPTNKSTKYTTPISITVATTLKVIAYKAPDYSTVTTYVYTAK